MIATLQGLPRCARTVLAIAVITTIAACDDGNNNTDTGTADTGDAGADIDAAQDAGRDIGGDSGEPDWEPPPRLPPSEFCDGLDPYVCSFPWPSNLYIEDSETTVTGHKLNLPEEALPRTREGAPYSAAEYASRADGYSIAGNIAVVFPGVDVSQMATELSVGLSIRLDSQLIWLEVQPDGSVRRVPYFVELDVGEKNPYRRSLLAHAAEVLTPNRRHIVAFRNLVDTSGDPIERSDDFDRLVARDTTGDPRLEPRQARFDDIFARLEDEDIDMDDVVLAWDFHTASRESMTGRLEHMRDVALEAAGPDGPPLTIVDIREFSRTDDGSGLPVDPNIALEIEGTFTATEFVSPVEFDDTTGYFLQYGEDGNPAVTGTREVPFWVRIPYGAVGPDAQAHTMQMYGHEALGSAIEFRAEWVGQIQSSENVIMFAADLDGFANYDNFTVGTAVSDLSWYRWVTDRLHQGIVQFALLARSMKQRFADLPQIQAEGIAVDDSEVHYFGAATGGTFGPTIMAASPDLNRGFYDVPGVNWSLILERSFSLSPFIQILSLTYPDRFDLRTMLFLTQLLWDGTEPMNYLDVMLNEPFGDDPTGEALITVTRGDWSTPVVTYEVVARSKMGIELMEGYGRAVYGVTPVSYPHSGSGIISFDFGNEWAFDGNKPPEDEIGDPHIRPRSLEDYPTLIMHFMRTGEIIDVCNDDGIVGCVCAEDDEGMCTSL